MAKEGVEEMNVSKWNAYYLAKYIKEKYPSPNGIALLDLHYIIKEGLGTDKRTIQKYMKILTVNKYILNKPNQTNWYIVNPKMDTMKPLSIKELFQKAKRENLARK